MPQRYMPSGNTVQCNHIVILRMSLQQQGEDVALVKPPPLCICAVSMYICLSVRLSVANA